MIDWFYQYTVADVPKVYLIEQDSIYDYKMQNIKMNLGGVWVDPRCTTTVLM